MSVVEVVFRKKRHRKVLTGLVIRRLRGQDLCLIVYKLGAQKSSIIRLISIIDTGNCRYGVDLAKQLAVSLLSVLVSCGSVRISFSERTPQKVSNFIVKELGNNPKFYIWDGQEPNPRMGHLAWADAFVVTADSVSMISEACSTGKPVYIIGAERCRWKFTEFHKSLRERGVVRPFTGSEDISESWSYPPLNDTADAAKRVHETLAARGWKLKT